MEPIVLMGLIVVVYGGYVALLDLWGDLSACFPRQTARVADRFSLTGTKSEVAHQEDDGGARLKGL